MKCDCFRWSKVQLWQFWGWLCQGDIVNTQINLLCSGWYSINRCLRRNFRLSVSKGYQIAWQLLVQCEWFQQQTQRTVWKHSFSSRRWVEVGFGRQPNFTIVFLSVLNWLIKCQNQRLQTEMNTVIPISSWSNLVWHILLWVIHLSVY